MRSLRLILFFLSRRLHRRAVATAEHRTRQRAGMIFFFHQHLPVDDGHFDADCFLMDSQSQLDSM